jgi:hypothetical protein
MAGSRSASPYSDKDNYWEGYASSNISQNALNGPPNVTVDDEDKAEAAYWASYAVVHGRYSILFFQTSLMILAGSGDSTVPSPRAEKKDSTHHHGIQFPGERGPDTAFDPFVANLHLRLQRKDSFLSPRYSHSDGSYSPQPTDEPPQEKSAPQSDLCDASHSTMLGQSSLDICGSNSCAMHARSVTEDDGKSQDSEGLKEVVRGLYSMWKKQTGLTDPERFISIVKEALE